MFHAKTSLILLALIGDVAAWLHQKNNETNPKNLRFDYSPNADCGWKNSDCAELTLRTFLHHYKQNQLDRYLFNNYI